MNFFNQNKTTKYIALQKRVCTFRAAVGITSCITTITCTYISFSCPSNNANCSTETCSNWEMHISTECCDSFLRPQHNYVVSYLPSNLSMNEPILRNTVKCKQLKYQFSFFECQRSYAGMSKIMHCKPKQKGKITDIRTWRSSQPTKNKYVGWLKENKLTVVIHWKWRTKNRVVFKFHLTAFVYCKTGILIISDRSLHIWKYWMDWQTTFFFPIFLWNGKRNLTSKAKAKKSKQTKTKSDIIYNVWTLGAVISQLLIS